MHYYIENTKTHLGKYLSWFDNHFTSVEWLAIYTFYSNHPNFTLTVINKGH